ncbi:MAG: hypothetical protein V4686_01955 [Patescibacteria group bacterium]
MKKFVIVLFLVVTSLFAASPIKDAVVAKILAIKVKELVTPEFIKKIGEKYPKEYEKSNFKDSYRVCREEVYGGLFEYDPTNYYQFRTITVALLKEQLHSKNTLLEVYTSCRESFIENVKAQKPEFQTSLILLLKTTIAELESVKTKEGRSKMIGEFEQQQFNYYGASTEEIERLLASNTSAAKIADKVLKEEPMVETKTLDQDHLDIIKFALRRWNEGGKVLIDKYLTVLRMAEKDIAEK